MYERLKYEFDNPTDTTVEVSLKWEKLRISFTIEAEVFDITMAMFKDEFLRSPHKFDWLGGWYAAAYCESENKNLDQALDWINMSIQAAPNFNNLRLKSEILTKLKRTEEAKQAMDFALKIATVYDTDSYIFYLIRERKIDEAFELAKANAKKYPDVGNVNGGLARTYSAKGNYKEAVKYTKLALVRLDDLRWKPYWERAIKKLESGKDMNLN